MQSALLALSTILVVIGPITYMISIVRGTSKPHRMTRFILFFVLTLNFLSILSAHGNIGAELFAGIVFLQAAALFLISLRYGVGGASLFDYICLGIAIVGILVWKFTGNPVVGIWFSILADFVAYLPAFVKTWNQPSTESPWYYILRYYILSGFAALASLLAYSLDVSSIFQFYIILSCLVMLSLIYHKKIFQ